ncbi:ATP-binding protein [Malaciobacter mytili]|uniref:sensor histidine kinase n=1 Tax=Malaciobacter mytili TaxID=603050 RepID=UPI003BB17FB4
MNSKIKDFLISQSIIFIFTLVLILFLNYVFISYFGLNQENFIFIIVPLVIFGLILYLFLSKPIFQPLFKSDENLQKTVKETLHELNIPVSTILLNTQMLQRKIEDEKALQRLQRIQKASKDLLKLYEEMEYSIKKEIDNIDKKEFYLDEIVQNSLEKFEDIKKDIEIQKAIKSNVLINSDINGFIKVIDNLLSNAIKYNKEKGFVKIEFKDSILSFENSGKTIDTKYLFDVFDRYFQEDSSTNGFGLGLNIVKEFCDKHKITINIIPLKDGTKIELNLKKVLK